ncbi:hypothetical protein EDC65_4499 [Stella humosa]|uniref:Protease inhibitor Inh n=1 Tax=Stella humosa TaxID=94 RepID=A0A3N1KYY4_9PROT|nr:hypothetical protein [Stella humosa]ROP83850.1 hypothetical protein EDC65_4499 [Stella humosa]BBK32889.1 hypothetical protein STHU_35230 [Stella humosa]
MRLDHRFAALAGALALAALPSAAMAFSLCVTVDTLRSEALWTQVGSEPAQKFTSAGECKFFLRGAGPIKAWAADSRILGGGIDEQECEGFTVSPSYQGEIELKVTYSEALQGAGPAYIGTCTVAKW